MKTNQARPLSKDSGLFCVCASGALARRSNHEKVLHKKITSRHGRARIIVSQTLTLHIPLTSQAAIGRGHDVIYRKLWLDRMSADLDLMQNGLLEQVQYPLI